MKSVVVFFVLCFALAMGQRSPYAGSRPGGTVSSNTNNPTGNRNDPAPMNSNSQGMDAQQSQQAVPQQPAMPQGGIFFCHLN